MVYIAIVENCEDCPCRKAKNGHGEYFMYCSHPERPDGFESVLGGYGTDLKKVPKWCPLLKLQKKLDEIETNT